MIESKVENPCDLINGDKVRISDGTPEPPRHHKKKHRDWYRRNQIGYVFGNEQPFGRISIKASKDSKVAISLPLNGLMIWKHEESLKNA